jgi:hypothetical protein
MKLRLIIALMSASLLALVIAVSSGAGLGPCSLDADSDGVCDDPTSTSDNCTAVANAGQRDDDQDGYGNVCDSDVNQDCVAGTPDVGAVFNEFGAGPGNGWNGNPAVAAFDLNVDDVVGTPDVGTAFNDFGIAPGPTSRTCADCNAIPLTGVCP